MLLIIPTLTKRKILIFHEHTINDCITYANRQIVTGKFEENHIINIDQTNIYFDETSTTA
jgi:hypothetical protein